MRLLWVLLLGVLIVSGTVRSAKNQKDGDDDNKDDNEDDNGNKHDGRYLVFYLRYKQIRFK
jgi:hypothetical protein